MRFDLPRPCAMCPFTKGTSMVLMPGRMQGIVESLRDDHQVFPCHKTTHADDDAESDEGEGGYTFSGTEQACMGALAYTLREYDRLAILTRLALARGDIAIETIEANFDAVEQPGRWPTY